MSDLQGTVQAVLFDAVGTLFEPAEPVGQLYARYAAAHGWFAGSTGAGDSELALGQLADALGCAFRGALAGRPWPVYRTDDREGNEQIDRLWWRELVVGVIDRIESRKPADFDVDTYFNAVFAAYGQASAWRLYPDVLPVLAALRQQGIRSAIVSNFDARLLPVCQGLGLDARVDVIVHSSAVGAAKPAPQVFWHALQLLEVEAARAVHVGDSLEQDVAGARAAGVHPVYLCRPPGTASLPSVPTVSNLQDLLEQIKA